jgi:Caspase domain
MGKGYSIHIGLDRTGPRYACGRFPNIPGCARAAEAMAQIASKTGFLVQALLVKPEEVTRQRVRDEMIKLQSAARGDTVLVTFAGHGERVRDLDGDEPAGDQALVLYDSFLLDDEIYEILTGFRQGVSVIFVADCCYGGSIIHIFDMFHALSPTRRARGITMAARGLTTTEGPAFARPDIDADVLLLSACSDDKRTTIGPTGMPRFTDALLRSWDDDPRRFPDGYETLLARIKENGAPQAHLFPENSALRTKKPFRIGR